MRWFLLPVVSFALLLSLLWNAFQAEKASRLQAVRPSAVTSEASQKLSSAAFGTIHIAALDVPRMISSLRASAASGSLASSAASAGAQRVVVYEYKLKSDLLPSIDSTLPAYRDQGATVTAVSFADMLAALRAPVDLSKIDALPREFSFESADGKLAITVRPQEREVTLSSLSWTSKPDANGPEALAANDAIVIARNFLLSVGADIGVFGTPAVASDRLPAKGVRTPFSSRVSWPLTVGGLAVIDRAARPVSALTVTIDGWSRRVTRAAFKFTSASALAASEYPVARRSTLEGQAALGGIAPLSPLLVTGDVVQTATPALVTSTCIVSSSLPAGVPPPIISCTRRSIEYVAVQKVYVLSEDADHRLPTYLVPMLWLEAQVPSECAGCLAVKWAALVPLLDAAQLHWVSAISASSSSTSKSGTPLPLLKQGSGAMGTK